MSGAVILAVGAVSALGRGESAFSVGRTGDRPRVEIDRDARLVAAGLESAVSARASVAARTNEDPAALLLQLALDQCLARLEAIDPAWRQKRVGLVVGTSSGGMISAERLFASLARGETLGRDLARGATYFGPLEWVLADRGYAFFPRVLVLGACSSSTLAVGIAMRWLALGRCDIALAGGFDALAEFVAAGFASLRATTASRPRPFRIGRDGMALGEGAAVMALSRFAPGGAAAARTLRIAGFGATTDAIHITAPDRTGSGLGRAATLALADAKVAPREIDLVSAHATATPFNDAAEARALAAALGDHGPRCVHPFKAQIGHTLGAAGALESLALLDAMQRDIAPGAAGEGELDPDCAVPLLETNEPLVSRAALKLSSAFGGTNAALVFLADDRRAVATPADRPGRAVFLRGFLTVPSALDQRALGACLGDRHAHLSRLDLMARLVLTAVHRLSRHVEPGALEGAGLVLGHSLATLEQNQVFDARRRERGARFVEPRRFPATSPNAAAGECAIAFQLTGPTFGVGSDLHGGLEALRVGRDLVAAGDAPAMLVVAADLAGAASSALLSAAGGPPLPEGACVALLGAFPASSRGASPGAAFPPETALGLEVPPSLSCEADFAWAGPAGHRELETYLRTLGSGRSLE